MLYINCYITVFTKRWSDRVGCDCVTLFISFPGMLVVCVIPGQLSPSTP